MSRAIKFLDVLRPLAPCPPIATLDELHTVATGLATHMQDTTGQCANYFLLWSAPEVLVLVLEARWGDDAEKEAALFFIRDMIAEGSVNAYAFIGEAYAVRVDKPAADFKRDDLPRSLKDHPNHYEILMSYAFDRDGGERATVYEFEPGKPDTRKLSDFSGLKDNWHMSGRLWNLFIARA